MDDPPAWAEPWPFWKFGLKQSDLKTTLHTKFNTISTSIQDPEAFHHDVCELSNRASTLDELEQLMEERKALRLKELNGMLEDASFEIIGSPQLIGNKQWGLAAQLFRTKSFDSLVRYFASYLPLHHAWHPDYDSDATGDTRDSLSPTQDVDYDGPILFDEPEDDDSSLTTHENSENLSTCHTVVDHPTRSNSLRSLDSGVSVSDRSQTKTHDQDCLPAQAMSIANFDFERIIDVYQNTSNILSYDDAPSLFEDADTPSTTISDLTQTEDHVACDTAGAQVAGEDKMEAYLSISQAHQENLHTMEPDTLNTKADAACSPPMPCFDVRQSATFRARSLSSNRSHSHHTHRTQHSSRNHRGGARQLRRGEASPDWSVKIDKAQGGKPGRRREVSPDQVRARARARRSHAGLS